jgi:hypothetical protein
MKFMPLVACLGGAAVVVGFAVVGIAFLAPARAADGPKVGDPVPHVTLKLDDGTELKLAEAKQAIVLYFYPKDNTSG